MESEFSFGQYWQRRNNTEGQPTFDKGSHQVRRAAVLLWAASESMETHFWKPKSCCFVPEKGILWMHTEKKCNILSFLASLWIMSHQWVICNLWRKKGNGSAAVQTPCLGSWECSHCWCFGQKNLWEEPFLGCDSAPSSVTGILLVTEVKHLL